MLHSNYLTADLARKPCPFVVNEMLQAVTLRCLCFSLALVRLDEQVDPDHRRVLVEGIVSVNNRS